jgi:hypothetical protein
MEEKILAVGYLWISLGYLCESSLKGPDIIKIPGPPLVKEAGPGNGGLEERSRGPGDLRAIAAATQQTICRKLKDIPGPEH